ncbi:MAG: SRPBCC family protein [Pseudomonadota bacterium]
MPNFRTTRSVNHSANNMFDLVADVESYPEFVPLCQSLYVRSQEETDDQTVLLADMTVAYKVLRETFTSRVVLDRDGLKITTQAVEGPFRNMENNWQFRGLSETTCDISFSLEYEFRSYAIQLLVGGLFDRAFRKYADAFEQRADQVYRRP